MFRGATTWVVLAGLPAAVPGCDEGDAVRLDDDAGEAGDTSGDGDAVGDGGGEDATGAGFDLMLSGVGFGIHEGQSVEGALVDLADGSVAARSGATVAGGSFALLWPGVLRAGRDYRVDYFVDYNENGECNAPPVDHGWTMAVPPFSDDVTLTVSHSGSFFPSVCDSFPRTAFDLVLSGVGFGFHDGQALSGALVDTGEGTVVARVSTTVASGSFELTWPNGLEAGRDYRVDYYADLNGSGACNPPPTDHGWTVAVPAFTDDVTLNVSHSTTFHPAVCDSF